MKNMRTTAWFAMFCLWSGLLLSGCDQLFDQLFCPEIEILTDTVPDGIVGKAYHAKIRADVKHSDNIDDMVTYDFSISSLPPGLTWKQDDNRVKISGTPLQAGSFGFVVNVDSPQLWDYKINKNSCAEPFGAKFFKILIN